MERDKKIEQAVAIAAAMVANRNYNVASAQEMAMAACEVVEAIYEEVDSRARAKEDDRLADILKRAE